MSVCGFAAHTQNAVLLSFSDRHQVNQELIPMATKTETETKKTDKADVTKPKRASKSQRTHVRRMKQEARKTTGVTKA